MKTLFCSDMTQAEFLAEYWQKKALYLPQAVPLEQLNCTAEELAGLSLEEEVESRLVSHDGLGHWRLRHGPFSESDFSQLGDTNWSLLVQDAHIWLEHLVALSHYAAFVPAWRFDDIMISYATPGGGVGPHVDSYDVFLVQGMGQRHWRVGHKDASTNRDQSNDELDLVLPFSCDFECTVKPGDVLYLPAQTPHEGIAQSPCMTYSIGFRNPSFGELLETFVTESLQESQPFPFEDQIECASPNLMSAQQLQFIQNRFFSALNRSKLFNRAFVKAASTTKFDPVPPDQSLVCTKELTHCIFFPINTCRYLMWYESEILKLAVCGLIFDISEAFGQWLDALLQEGESRLNLTKENDQILLLQLCNEGLVGFETIRDIE